MRELEIKQYIFEEVTIMELHGKIIIGEGSIKLRDVIANYLSEKPKDFILDLQGVQYIDGSGIGELVSAKSRAIRAGVDVVLVHLTMKIEDLLKITKVLTALDHFESLEEAIEHIKTKTN